MEKNFEWLPKEKKQWEVFIICVLIASLFWTLKTLSDSFKSEIVLQINYDLPEIPTEVIYEAPPSEIKVQIEAKGYELLLSNISPKRKKINLNAQDFDYVNTNKGKKWYYKLDKSDINFTEQLGRFTKIQGFEKDSICFFSDKIVNKKLPIKVSYKAQFDSTFYTIQSTQFHPDSILIIGAKSKIKNLKFWNINLGNLNIKANHFETSIPFNLPFGIKKSIPENLDFTIRLDALKLHKIAVPIVCSNCPPNKILQFFPPKVDVTFYCGIEQFKLIQKKSFKVVVDFEKVNLEDERINVQLEKFPSFVKEIKIYPAKVEFIERN
jgi:YbbR domain-containing protein